MRLHVPKADRLRTWSLVGMLAMFPGLARAEDAVRGYPACDKTPTDGDVTAAKGAFQAGNGSFNEADYERAINYWEDAYRRDCTAHPLLLNLARAYELNGQKRHAVTALKTFLERSPGSSEEGQIKRRVEKLDEQIRLEDQAASRPVQQPVTAPPPQTEPIAPPPAAEPASGGKRSIVPLIVAGGGAVVGVVGIVLYAGGQGDISDAEKICPKRDQCTSQSAIDQGNSGRSRATIGGWVTGIGGAAVVGGLIWYFVQPTTETASASQKFFAHVTPSVSPAFTGASLSGSF